MTNGAKLLSFSFSKVYFLSPAVETTTSRHHRNPKHAHDEQMHDHWNKSVNIGQYTGKSQFCQLGWKSLTLDPGHETPVAEPRICCCTVQLRRRVLLLLSLSINTTEYSLIETGHSGVHNPRDFLQWIHGQHVLGSLWAPGSVNILHSQLEPSLRLGVGCLLSLAQKHHS